MAIRGIYVRFQRGYLNFWIFDCENSRGEHCHLAWSILDQTRHGELDIRYIKEAIHQGSEKRETLGDYLMECHKDSIGKWWLTGCWLTIIGNFLWRKYYLEKTKPKNSKPPTLTKWVFCVVQNWSSRKGREMRGWHLLNRPIKEAGLKDNSLQ